MNSPLIPEIHRLFLTGALLLLAPAALAATTTDKFNDPSKWGKPIITEGKPGFVISNGRLNFTAATNVNSGGGIPRKSPRLPVDRDWNLQMDARIQAYPFTKCIPQATSPKTTNA